MNTQRIAVSTFFMANGIVYASWASRLPELEAWFGLSHSGLGTLLFVSALGAVLAMPFTGWLTIRYGSDQLTRWAGLLFCSLLSLLPLIPNPLVAGGIFFVLGISSGGLDVSMNGQAVVVEPSMGKAIMSSFHAMFSIGMAAGAGIGAGFAALNVDLRIHFLLVSLLCVVALLWASRHLARPPIRPKPSSGSKEPFIVLPTKAVLPLGILAFCGMTGEGSIADWSPIFIHEVVGAAESFSALGFAAFSVAMTLGRIFGDRVIHQLGRQRLLWYSCLLAVAGLSVVLGIAGVWLSLLGFFAIGLGLSNIVPIIYSAARNTPGVEPSVGIAMATTIGYAGFFVGPPLIGYLSDQIGLRLGLLFPLMLFGIMWLLIGKVQAAES